MVFCSSCEVGTEIVYVDPSIIISDEYFIEPVTGEPTVYLGRYVEQLYQDINEGDDLPVVWGLQGGTWTMPCIRIVGIASRATVDCSLTMDTGEVVGKVKAKTNFFLAADGFLEYHSFPIPVNHEVNEEEPIDDLYEQPATLNCSVTDDEERSNELAVSVMIIKG
jgi:hypothetical protein